MNIIVYIIAGSSMLPSFEDGQAVSVLLDFDYRKLQEGDVVIYKSKTINQSVCHRLVKKHKFLWFSKKWTAKGDNSKREDQEFVTIDNFVGVQLTPSVIRRYKKGTV